MIYKRLVSFLSSPLPSPHLFLSLVKTNLLQLLQEIHDRITQRRQPSSHLNQEHSPPRLGVVIFSLSEIILFLGEAWTLRWIQNLNQLIGTSSNPSAAAATASGVIGIEKSDPLASIIFLLHTSLHQHTSQAEIQVASPPTPPRTHTSSESLSNDSVRDPQCLWSL